ncbi:MAG TPA: DEAD/DEAH box helicase [Mycobacteriales bacterium]|nr:DEAD/DEAH box helicase [Mycobacteriales bacterium]
MSRSARRPRAAQSTTPATAWSTSTGGSSSGSARFGGSHDTSGRPGSPERGRSESGRPRSGGAGSGGGNRRRSGGRPASRPQTSRPAPAPSELELALTASLDAPAGPTDFTELKLPQTLLTGLQRRGITAPFPIQSRTLPDALAGRDMLGRAETGSGKTLAFGLPMLARLSGGSRRPAGTPGGLVLVPTRELAGQVQDALAPLGQPLGVRVLAIYGGASMGRQISSLRRGVDLLVATPGRLLDLIRQGECNLGEVEVTAIDEADHMADLGFLPDVTTILDMTRPGGQRLLFSATLDRGVDRLARAYLTDPVAIAVASAASPVSTMNHLGFTVRHDDKVAVLSQIVARPARTLIFVRTKHGADRLARQLSREGTEAGAIHGNLAQNARQRALDAFSAGRTRVLVATDVAARGIHVDDVDLVVHYDPPADHKDYLHRSGRTARAGAAGTVLSMLLPEQARDASRLFERAGLDVPITAVGPGHEAVLALGASGEPIEVRPEEPAARPAPGRGGRSGRPGQGRRPSRRPTDRGTRAPAA